MAPESSSLFSRVARWLVTHVVPVLSVLGVVVYAFLRVSYGVFYDRFGLEPEEVGVGRAQVLAQSGLLLVELALVFGAVMTFCFFALRALGGLRQPYRLPPGAPLWRRAVEFAQTPYWIIVLPTAIAVGLFLVVTLPDRARSLADKVERGETVRARTSFSYRSLEPHVKSLPATLISLGQAPLRPELQAPSLRYFGQANGTLVLFDWKTKKVIRLPAASYAVSTSG